jgi:LL-diaminopimelate aminotransferase
MREASRLLHLNEYYFSKKLEEVRSLDAQGRDIINLGIGSPDMAPPVEAVNALNKALMEPNAHQYQPYKGQLALRQAVQNFYSENYHVALNAESEILPLMGSKEGIFHISMAFLNEGDEVLIPNPGYPSYQSVTKMVGATPVLYELGEENNWMPDLAELAKKDLSKVKIMWVNYPHMPTGAIATKEILEQIVKFGIENDILIVNDNPYSFILNSDPQSILSVEGAKKTALELNSLSKTFNMAGWRIGMLAGSSEHLKTVLKVKSNMDSGMFYPLQVGAIAAMKVYKEWTLELNKQYALRKLKVLELVRELKCEPILGTAGLFVWAKIPTTTTSEVFIDKLLHKYGIFVAPGNIFGSQGEGYVRFSLCLAEDRIDEARQRIKKEIKIYTA